MISIRSSAAFDRAMGEAMNPDLRQLLLLRRDQLLPGADTDLGDLVHVVVAGQGDTLAAVEAEVGFPLRGDDAPVEWVERHPGRWLEAALIVSDDFTVALFARDCLCVTDPALLLALLALA